MSEGDDRSEVDILRDDVEAYRGQIIKPKLSQLEDRMDELEAENNELRETVEQQQAEIEQLDVQVENLIGVDDEDLSTHDKRVRDVRAAMIRRAEAKAEKRSGSIEGKVALYYAEIKDLLADHGHGDIHREQAHRIMDDIEHVDGFSKGTKTSKHGNDVKAIRLNLEALPAYARRHNVTTPGDERGAENTPKSAGQHNQS